MNHHNVSTTVSGPRAKCDQVIFEAICKACEVIVGSRAASSVVAMPAAPTSTRFNLQIPQVAGVRQILSAYRMQLELPVRLDVYYQDSNNNNRQLLERWCLEYDSFLSASERFLQQVVVSNDPMVQLTHVCKRIVLWLRTLYCWTRLLPSQIVKQQKSKGAGEIGFSIYVNADGSDDITELTNQGFLLSRQQHGNVTTPYGELTWQVLYCPSLERLFPSRSSTARTPSVRIQTPPRPIPVAQQPQQLFAPKSAPQRALTFTERSQQKRMQAAAQQQQKVAFQQGKSYDPSRLLYHRSNTTVTTVEQNNFPGLQRSSTTIGAADENPPGRVLSGLSLALMMASNEDDVVGGENSDTAKTTSTSPDDEDEDAVVVEQDQEKTRRVALHQMPPHLLESSPPSTGEYGYGYNNYIPWQKIHPSTTHPASVEPQATNNSHHSVFARTLSTSPSAPPTPPLQQHYSTTTTTPQTPPGAAAAFLGTTPPVSSLAHLIPPRSNRTSGSDNNNKSITPPFQPRPAGFWHEPPSLSLEPSQMASVSSAKTATPTPKKEAMSSLDLLRSSPFQQQSQQQMLSSSMPFSSLSFAPPGSDFYASSNVNNNNLDMRRSLWSTSGSLQAAASSSFQSPEDYYSEDMPFAVEFSETPSKSSLQQAQSTKSATVNTTSSSSIVHSSSFLGNSAALASLAHKCSAPSSHRLKLFEKTENGQQGLQQNDDNDDHLVVGSLADQLQEFRVFGASLHGLDGTATAVNEADQLRGSSGSSTTTSTPIPLRS